MAQTLNALHTTLSDGKESLAKNTSMRPQADHQDTGIGHVGLRATNLAASAEFYRDIFGMEVAGGSTPDHPLGASAFLTSRPGEQSHEIALFANPIFAHVAFKVSSLAEFRSFGEECPNQVCIQPSRVLRLLLRGPRWQHDRNLLAHWRSEPGAALRGTPRSFAIRRSAA